MATSNPIPVLFPTVIEKLDDSNYFWRQQIKPSLSRVIGSIHTYQVWEKIHEYFHMLTKAHGCQYPFDAITEKFKEKKLN